MNCNIFVITFLFLSSYVATTTSANINHTIKSQSESRISIRQYLKKIKKSSVKTIKSPDGDIIECVPFHQQPAFDHPLLQGERNKTIPLPELPKGYFPDNDTAAFDPETFQVWRMSGESCPENTVPIRRASEEEILIGQTIRQKKALSTGHEHAIGYALGSFFGGEATFNVWLPRVANRGEFSLAQTWVISGRIDKGTFNSIEAGWQVRQGDHLPRLFVFWTRDAYHTGCYDFDCSGFCLVNQHVSPGLALSPVSQYNGNQQQLKLTVWKAPENGHWWLAVNGVVAGYWSSRLFPLLGPGAAESVEFGGEILNYGGPGQHTTTQMGSGHFPFEGFKRAAFIKKLGLVNSNNKVYPARRLGTVIYNSNCYDLKISETNDPFWLTFMYYGGPGRGGRCQ